MTDITIADMLAGARRELAMRNGVYAKRVNLGSMKPEDAARLIAEQQATVDHFQLFDSVKDGHAIVLWFKDHAVRAEFDSWLDSNKKIADKLLGKGFIG